MHTHLSLFEGDRNAFYESGAEYQLSKVGRSFIAGLLKHAARDHRRHQPVGQLLQAHLGRLGAHRGRGRRGPLVHLLGPQQPLRAGPGADVQAAARPARPASRSARSTPARNPYLAFARAARRRPEGHRGGLRAARRAPRTTSGRCPTPSAARWASSRCRRTSARRSTLMERSELVAETLGEHVFDFFLRNKRAGVGGVPPRGHRRSSCGSTCRCCKRRSAAVTGTRSTPLRLGDTTGAWPRNPARMRVRSPLSCTMPHTVTLE